MEFDAHGGFAPDEEEDVTAMADVEEEDYDELFFTAVLESSDFVPQKYIAAATQAIAVSRGRALRRRNPPTVAHVINMAFGDRFGAAGSTPGRYQQKDERLALPTVGLSVAPVDVDPVVESIREERQLWRLLHQVTDVGLRHQLGLHAAAAERTAIPTPQSLSAMPAAGSSLLLPQHCALSAGASLPLDASAAGRAALPALLHAHDPQAFALVAVREWLRQGALDDAQIRGPDGRLRSAEGTLRHLESAAAAAGGAGPASGGAELPLAGLCDPDDDAPASEGAAQAEADLLASMWQLLRCGGADTAAELAAACGQPWRAALVSGMAASAEAAGAGDGAAGSALAVQAALDCADALLHRAGAASPSSSSALSPASAAGDAGSGPLGEGPHAAAHFEAAICRLTALSVGAVQPAPGGSSRGSVAAEGGSLMGRAAAALLSQRSVVRTWEDAAAVMTTAALRARELAAHATVASLAACLPAAGAPPALGAHETLLRDVPRTVDDVFDRLAGRGAATSRPDIAAAAGTGYAALAQAALRLAVESAPHADDFMGPSEVAAWEAAQAASALSQQADLQPPALPLRARLRLSRAVARLVATLHDVAFSGRAEFVAAAAANACSLTVTADTRPLSGGNEALTPAAADAFRGADPLPPPAVAALRFGVHATLFLRSASLLRGLRVLQPLQVDGEAGEEEEGGSAQQRQQQAVPQGLAGAEAAEAARLLAEEGDLRALVHARIDDLLLGYCRHLLGTSPRLLGHANGALVLLRFATPRRAVRFVAAWALALEPSLSDASAAAVFSPEEVEALIGRGAAAGPVLLHTSARRLLCAHSDFVGATVEGLLPTVRNGLRCAVALISALDGRVLADMAAGLPAGRGASGARPHAAAAVAVRREEEERVRDTLFALGLRLPAGLPLGECARFGVACADVLRLCGLGLLLPALHGLGRVPLVAGADGIARLAEPLLASGFDPQRVADVVVAANLLARRVLWKPLLAAAPEADDVDAAAAAAAAGAAPGFPLHPPLELRCAALAHEPATRAARLLFCGLRPLQAGSGSGGSDAAAAGAVLSTPMLPPVVVAIASTQLALLESRARSDVAAAAAAAAAGGSASAAVANGHAEGAADGAAEGAAFEALLAHTFTERGGAAVQRALLEADAWAGFCRAEEAVEAWLPLVRRPLPPVPTPPAASVPGASPGSGSLTGGSLTGGSLSGAALPAGATPRGGAGASLTSSASFSIAARRSQFASGRGSVVSGSMSGFGQGADALQARASEEEWRAYTAALHLHQDLAASAGRALLAAAEQALGDLLGEVLAAPLWQAPAASWPRLGAPDADAAEDAAATLLLSDDVPVSGKLSLAMASAAELRSVLLPVATQQVAEVCSATAHWLRRDPEAWRQHSPQLAIMLQQVQVRLQELAQIAGYRPAHPLTQGASFLRDLSGSLKLPAAGSAGGDAAVGLSLSSAA